MVTSKAFYGNGLFQCFAKAQINIKLLYLAAHGLNELYEHPQNRNMIAFKYKKKSKHFYPNIFKLLPLLEDNKDKCKLK